MWVAGRTGSKRGRQRVVKHTSAAPKKQSSCQRRKQSQRALYSAAVAVPAAAAASGSKQVSFTRTCLTHSWQLSQPGDASAQPFPLLCSFPATTTLIFMKIILSLWLFKMLIIYI